MTTRTRHTENAAGTAGSRAFTRTNDAALVVWRLLCITGSYYISAVEKTGKAKWTGQQIKIGEIGCLSLPVCSYKPVDSD